MIGRNLANKLELHVGGKNVRKKLAEKSKFSKTLRRVKKSSDSQKKTIRHEILPNGMEQKKTNDINNSGGKDHEVVLFCTVGVSGLPSEMFRFVLNNLNFLAIAPHGVYEGEHIC